MAGPLDPALAALGAFRAEYPAYAEHDDKTLAEALLKKDPQRWAVLRPIVQPPAQAKDIFTSPQGFMGPGALAHTYSMLTGKGVPQAEASVNQGLRIAAPIAGSLAIRGPLGAMGQIGTQATLSGGATAATKGGLEDIIRDIVVGGGTQGVVSGGFKTLELLANSKAGRAMIAQEAGRARAALENFTSKKAFDEAMAGALDKIHVGQWKDEILKQSKEYAGAVAKQAAETGAAVKQGGEKAASGIMDFVKSKIPAWQGLPSDVSGLTDALFGKGQTAIHSMYDEALKEVKQVGAGVPVNVPDWVAKKLGLSAMPVKLDAKGALPSETVKAALLGQQGAGTIAVDAGQLAEAMTGKSSTASQAYRSAARALDASGVGNAEARGQYRLAMSLRDIADWTKSLTGQTASKTKQGLQAGELNVEALWKGLHDPSVIDRAMTGGLGHLTEGPLQASVRGGRVAPPAEIPKPTPPAKPAATVLSQEAAPMGERTAEELGIKRMGNVGQGGLGYGAGWGLGYGIGHMFSAPWIGAHLGGPLGGAAALKLPHMITETPITKGLIDALRQSSLVTGGVASGAANEFLGSGTEPPNP